MTPKLNFDQFLVKEQVLTQEVLAVLLVEAQNRKVTLFQCLLEKKVMTEENLAKVMARYYGVEYQPSPIVYDTKLVAKFPLFTLRRYKIVPLGMEDKQVKVAIQDPGNFLVTDEIRKFIKMNLILVCATDTAIQEALSKIQNQIIASQVQNAFGTPPPSGTLISKTAAPPTAATKINPATTPIKKEAATAKPLVKEEASSGNTTVSQAAEAMLESAFKRSASDIHIEPLANGGVIRERVDGTLHEIQKLSQEQLSTYVSRLKLLGGMDIVEKRLAQDGRFKFKQSEIRCSILPTIFGEKMVLRLLRNDRVDPTIQMLDIGADREAKIKEVIDLTDGLVIVAGPTGSGKSTTIYAILRSLDRKSHNLITVEDPVEYELEGANQVQVNQRIGITFTSTLPFLLRQDPDIMMIGEVRDEETAQMVMRSAISGHLVFTTIHAPDALDTVVRLVDMNVEKHIITAALKVCISQRLLRKLCLKCRVSYSATPKEKKVLHLDENAELKLFAAKGCVECHGIGYYGRFAAIEILFLNEDICEAIMNNEKKKLKELAKASGFISMHDHAVERVIKGDTSYKEMLAICPERK